jgi:hypothetical protein
MDLSKVGNWLQVLGNIGLIAGLALVAIQINQNTQLARIQLIHDSMLANQNMHLVLAGENPGTVWSKAIFEPEMLSDEEMVVADRILRANWARVMRLDVLYQLGFDLFDPTAVAAVTVFDYLGTEFSMAWWYDPSQAPNPTYAKTMNEILESLPNHSTYEKDRLNRIREKISKSRP